QGEAPKLLEVSPKNERIPSEVLELGINLSNNLRYLIGSKREETSYFDICTHELCNGHVCFNVVEHELLNPVCGILVIFAYIMC
ncbi:hypothetical protein PSY31_22500, partial [Shigella flexneri]|nr:hypothetical protein [Shigella flexneri]